MKGNFWKVLASGTIAASMLVGCSSGGAANEAVTLSEGDTVKIGLNYELSGNVATYGQAMNKGTELAIKQYNESEDAKYKAEAVSMDNKSDSGEAYSIATKLMTEDQVVMQVGPATSGDSIATYPAADENQTPVLSQAVTQNGGMLKEDGSAYEYAWRVCFEDSAQASAMAVFARENLGKTKAVVYSDATSDYAKGLAEDFVSKFEALGGEVVAQESYSSGDTDFNAALSKISEEEYKTRKDTYSQNDIIGKTGIESVFEEYLKGENGTMTYIPNKNTTLEKKDGTWKIVYANLQYQDGGLSMYYGI